jgi:hypothetical protein
MTPETSEICFESQEKKSVEAACRGGGEIRAINPS